MTWRNNKNWHVKFYVISRDEFHPGMTFISSRGDFHLGVWSFTCECLHELEQNVFSLALPSWLLKLPFLFTTAPRKRNESSRKAMHLKLASCVWASNLFKAIWIGNMVPGDFHNEYIKRIHAPPIYFTRVRDKVGHLGLSSNPTHQLWLMNKILVRHKLEKLLEWFNML